MGPPVIASVGYAISATNGDLTFRVFTNDLPADVTDAYFRWHATVLYEVKLL